MKLDDFLSRLFAFLERRELLEGVAEKTVWLIACYSAALGLALAAALLCARQGAALARVTRREPR